MAVAAVEEWRSAAGGLGDQVAYHRLDLTHYDSARDRLQQIAGEMGGLDALINNAGVMAFENAHEATSESIRRHLAVNLEAPIHLTGAALSIMVAQGSGQIINIASVAAVKATPKLAVYSAAKAGLLQYTRSIAAEYAAKKIRANVICPGCVETALTSRVMYALIKRGIPLGEFQTPQEIAGLVNWLLSEEARNVTGAVFSMDGGMSL